MNYQKKCPKCGAINDGFFEYCFKCGTSLNSGKSYNQGFSPFSGGYYEPDTIGGHPAEDVRAFVGFDENSQKLTRKLIDTEISGSNIHWCWPVFLFSLLGPMFAAIWFFFRKMYKTGLLVALLGLLISGADVLLHLEYNMAYMRELVEILTSSENFAELLSRLQADVTTLPSQGSIGVLLSSVIDLISIAARVTVSMFAVGIYKNHIRKTLSDNPNARGDMFALGHLGGTSIGAAAIAGGVLLILLNLLENLPWILVLAI